MAAPFKNVSRLNFKQFAGKILSRSMSSVSESASKKLCLLFYLSGFIKKCFSIYICTFLGKVIVLKQKSLYLIGINRPEKRNSIDDETASELRKAFEDFENDEEAYAAVLYGKGNVTIAHL